MPMYREINSADAADYLVVTADKISLGLGHSVKVSLF